MNPENPLVKHIMIHHPGEQPKFDFKLDKVCKNSLARQVGEALKIAKSYPSKIMNSKAEFGGNKIPRITVEDDRNDISPVQPGATNPRNDSSSSARQTQSDLSPTRRKRRRREAAQPAVIPSAGMTRFLTFSQVAQGLGMSSRGMTRIENTGNCKENEFRSLESLRNYEMEGQLTPSLGFKLKGKDRQIVRAEPIDISSAK